MPDAIKGELANSIGAVLGDDKVTRSIQRISQAARLHLNMDIAFVSEFVDGRRIFREVSASSTAGQVRIGDSDPLEESYCQRVVDGRLPELMPDAQLVPAAMELPVTAALPVGAHMSVPLKLGDGRVYGTFCCFSSAPNSSLNERDLRMLCAFADLALHEIERDLESTRARDEKILRVKSALEQQQLSIVYQPIYRIDDHAIVGMECLTRISAPPHRPPNVWFEEAAEVGMAIDLELAAIEVALQGLQFLNAGVYLAVNTSPAAVLSGRIATLLEDIPASRLVLKITEHAIVPDYALLASALTSLRSRGVRLAVDDAGAGYSSLRHILTLQPELIKLDMDLTRDIDKDPARRALAAALVSFARQMNAQIVAEGVETASELEVLRALRVGYAQGYLLSRPVPLESAATLLVGEITRSKVGDLGK